MSLFKVLGERTQRPFFFGIAQAEQQFCELVERIDYPEFAMPIPDTFLGDSVVSFFGDKSLHRAQENGVPPKELVKSGLVALVEGRIKSLFLDREYAVPIEETRSANSVAIDVPSSALRWLDAQSFEDCNHNAGYNYALCALLGQGGAGNSEVSFAMEEPESPTNHARLEFFLRLEAGVKVLLAGGPESFERAVEAGNAFRYYPDAARVVPFDPRK
ncbi:MAG: hypothetical protein ACPGRX_02250 [Bdellovibrionales bacterium]